MGLLFLRAGVLTISSRDSCLSVFFGHWPSFITLKDVFQLINEITGCRMVDDSYGQRNAPKGKGRALLAFLPKLRPLAHGRL
jgi:hypothetical protein